MLKRRIKEKLRSEQGTSIFFGLLLFLVASILSVTILEGAVTTVKTVASDRASEQNQLACTSAAQLLRDSIMNVKLWAEVEVRKSNNATDTSKTTKTWEEPSGNFAKMLQGYMKEADRKIYNEASPDFTVTKKLILSNSGSGTTEAFTQFNELDKINAEMTIKPQKSSEAGKENEVTYDMVIKLSTGTGTDSSHVILSLTGKVQSELKSNNETTDSERIAVTRYEYSWEAKDIFYGDEERTLGDS